MSDDGLPWDAPTTATIAPTESGSPPPAQRWATVPAALAGALVERLTPAIGAQITGIDLAAADADVAAAIEALLLEHQVLFFPEQHLDVEAHVALGRWFGPLAAHPNLANPFTDHPELFELAASSGGIADEWHTDLTFLPEPAVLSILRLVECPPLGGDTMWTNLHLAYEHLSEPLRALVDGLHALHDATPHGHPEQSTVHPVVRTHPVTGRKALYVNEHFTRRIIELSPEESDVLLRHLTRWVHDPRFTVRYRWQPGTVAIWDNRCTQHYVLNDFDAERVIQRVTVMGDRPTGEPPRWPPYRAVRGAASHRSWNVRRHLRAVTDEPSDASTPTDG